jgi:hypothetical protein
MQNPQAPSSRNVGKAAAIRAGILNEFFGHDEQTVPQVWTVLGGVDEIGGGWCPIGGDTGGRWRSVVVSGDRLPYPAFLVFALSRPRERGSLVFLR